MTKSAIPANLISLHQAEEALRDKAVAVVVSDDRLTLHVGITECVMDMLDIFRQIKSCDEDFKVVQMLSLRLFNAFASTIKLAFSGYSQISALIMRDILETVFLLDLFRSDRGSITRWRFASSNGQKKEFQPVAVRIKLDKRDGATTNKRAELYKLLSELAAHPNMRSVAMLRPKGMDARNGPFIDPSGLEAVVSEMGRLAVHVGDAIDAFFPPNQQNLRPLRTSFFNWRSNWVARFDPTF